MLQIFFKAVKDRLEDVIFKPWYGTMGLPKDLKLVRRVVALSLPSSGDADDADTAVAYFDEDGIAQICNVALFDAGYDGSSSDIVDGALVKAALSGNGKSYQLACSIIASGDIDDDGDSVVDVRCSYRGESGKLTVAAKFGSAATAAKAQSVESISIKKPTRSDLPSKAICSHLAEDIVSLIQARREKREGSKKRKALCLRKH